MNARHKVLSLLPLLFALACNDANDDHDSAEADVVVGQNDLQAWSQHARQAKERSRALERAAMGFVGLKGYAESGKWEELVQKYGLTAADIVREAELAVARKP